MNLKEFREKYPSYNNRSDEELLRALHTKYYSNRNYDDFVSRMNPDAEKVVETEQLINDGQAYEVPMQDGVSKEESVENFLTGDNEPTSISPTKETEFDITIAPEDQKGYIPPEKEKPEEKPYEPLPIDPDRPIVTDDEGDHSELTTSFWSEEEEKEVLIRTVVDGKRIDPKDAWQMYLGGKNPAVAKFDTAEEANKFAGERTDELGRIGDERKNKPAFSTSFASPKEKAGDWWGGLLAGEAVASKAAREASELKAGVEENDPEAIGLVEGLMSSFAGEQNRWMSGVLEGLWEFNEASRGRWPTEQTHPEIIATLRERAKELEETGQKGKEQFLSGVEDFGGPATSAVAMLGYDIVDGAAKMVPSIITAKLSGSANVGLSVMGTQVWGSTYSRAKEEGKDSVESFFEATRSTAYEIGPEKLFGYFDKLGGKGVRDWAMQALREGSSEVVTSILEQTDEVWMQGDAWEGWGKATKRALYDFLVGLGMGATLSSPMLLQKKTDTPGSDATGPDSGPQELSDQQGSLIDGAPAERRLMTPEELRVFVEGQSHEDMMAKSIYKRAYNASELGEVSLDQETRQKDARESFIRLQEGRMKWKPIVDAAKEKLNLRQEEHSEIDQARKERRREEEQSPESVIPADDVDPSEVLTTSEDGTVTEYSVDEAAQMVEDHDNGKSNALSQLERDQLLDQLDIRRKAIDDNEAIDDRRDESRESRPLNIKAAPIEQLNATDIGMNPEVFQYKSGVDEKGRSTRLKGLKEWDIIKAGVIIAWEDSDSKPWVADGHQRVGKLQEMIEAGEQGPTQVNAFVLRSSDGWTAKDVRTVASLRNIAQGSGTAIDAAKVLRQIDPARMPDVMAQIPPNSSLVRDANGLSKLGEDAFLAVVNESVKPTYGAMVGQAFEETEQLAAIEILSKAKPSSIAEAHAMIGDIQAGGFVESQQAGLFGDVEMESFIKERAQILTSAESGLKKDAKIFKALTTNEQKITSAGENVLDTKANQAIADEALSLVDTAFRTINTTPEINNVLNELAGKLKTGSITKSEAAKQLVEAARAYSESSSSEPVAGPVDTKSESKPEAKVEPTTDTQGSEDGLKERQKKQSDKARAEIEKIRKRFEVGGIWGGSSVLIEELEPRVFRKKLQKGMVAREPKGHHTETNGQGPWFVAFEKVMATNMHPTKKAAIAEYRDMYPEESPGLGLGTETTKAKPDAKVTDFVPAEIFADDLVDLEKLIKGGTVETINNELVAAYQMLSKKRNAHTDEFGDTAYYTSVIEATIADLERTSDKLPEGGARTKLEAIVASVNAKLQQIPGLELTPEPTAVEDATTKKKIKAAEQEEVPVESGAGDLFAGPRSDDMFPNTTLAGEQEQQADLIGGNVTTMSIDGLKAEAIAKRLDEDPTLDPEHAQRLQWVVITKGDRVGEAGVVVSTESIPEESGWDRFELSILLNDNTIQKRSADLRPTFKEIKEADVIKNEVGKLVPKDGSKGLEAVIKKTGQEISHDLGFLNSQQRQVVQRVLDQKFNEETVLRFVDILGYPGAADLSGQVVRSTDAQNIWTAMGGSPKKKAALIFKQGGTRERVTFGLGATKWQRIVRGDYLISRFVEEIPAQIIVQAVQDRIEYLEQRGKDQVGLNFDDIPSKSEGVGTQLKSIGASVTVSKRDTMKLMGDNMYSQDLIDIAIKEMTQNSFDAIKESIYNNEIVDGLIEITTDTKDRTLKIEDNGVGMTSEVLNEVFFVLSKSYKGNLPIDQRSGGFGAAKIGIYGSVKSLTVETTKDGVRSVVHATADQIASDDVDAFTIERFKANPKAHGTIVTLEIPESYIDRNGHEHGIFFPHSEKYLTLFQHPLLHDNVEIRYNGAVMPVGKHQNMKDMPLETRATFDWGSAEIYFGTEKNKYADHEVLSSGVYQFGAFWMANNERIPYDITIDIHTTVDAKDADYPFELDRESFKKRVQKDIDALEKYLGNIWLSTQLDGIKNVFKDLVTMPYIDIGGGSPMSRRAAENAFKKPAATAKKSESESDLKKLRETKEKKASQIRISEGKTTDAVTGKALKSEKGKLESSFKPEKEIRKKKDFEIAMTGNPRNPIFHNNTNVDYLQVGKDAGGNPEQFFSELGSILLRMRDIIVESKIYGFKKLSAENLYFGGVSIDKGYEGVHLTIPYKSIFINPFGDKFGATTPVGYTEALYNTMIHELAHVISMKHDPKHNSAQLQALVHLSEIDEAYYLRDAIRETITRHKATYEAMNDAFNRSDTKNTGKSYKDIEENATSREDGGAQSKREVQSGDVQKQGQSRWGEGVRAAGRIGTGSKESSGILSSGEDAATGLNKDQLKNVQDGESQLSLAQQRTDGLSVKAAKSAVRKGLGGRLVGRVEIYETLSDLPNNVRNDGRKIFSRSGAVEGFVKGRKAYLISRNLASSERATWVAWHELWHRGAKIKYGLAYDHALKRARENVLIRRLSDAIKGRRKDLSGPRADLQATDEALAELSAAMRSGRYGQIEFLYQIKIPNSMKAGWRAVVRKWVDRIKQIVGAKERRAPTDAQIHNMLSGMNLDATNHSDRVDAERSQEFQFSVSPERQPFEDPEVEKRIQRGLKGTAGLSGRSRVWDEIKDGFKHYVHLPKTPYYSDGMEQLRKLEAAPQASKEQTVRLISLITENMTPEELEIFTIKVILDDLAYEVEQDHDLPFGLTAEMLPVELEKITTQVESIPALREAVEARRVMVKSIANNLVASGVLTEDQIANPSYYRHQILDYAMAKQQRTGKNRSLKKPKWYGREGSLKDINARYLEAEFEWLNKALNDISAADTISWFGASKYNDRDQTVARGRESNDKHFEAALEKDMADNGYEVFNKKGEVIRETSPMREEDISFKRRIAMAINEIKSALDEGLVDVPAQYAESVNILMNEQHLTDPNFFRFIAWIADNAPAIAAHPARSVFKTINQKKAWKRSIIGERYVNTGSIGELIEKGFSTEGYVAWQPDKGMLLFTAKTIPEHVIDRMISHMAEDTKGLTAAEINEITRSIRESLVVGGPKFQMILPAELAMQLDNISDEHAKSLTYGLFSSGLKQWKRWQLISPWRVLKYNINNLSGDMDAMLNQPKVALFLPRAIKELTQVMYRGKSPSAEFSGAVRRGVFDAGMSIQEIPQINELEPFKNLTDPVRLNKKPIKWAKQKVLKVWSGLQKATWWRENWIRYAAYLYNLDRLKNGGPLTSAEYGASRPEMVDAITSVEDKAGLLSRQLIGDYGAISHHGENIRRHTYPFWSWVEINFRRYWRLSANAWNYNAYQGIKQGTITSTALGLKAATWMSFRAGAFFILVHLYNSLIHGDDEEELTEMERQRMHINLGKDKDGNVVTLRFQGALSDFLSWFGHDDIRQAIAEVERGRGTWKDVMLAMPKATVNKFVGGVTPIVKVPFEMALGVQFWPDVTNPRRIRDKWRYGWQTWALEHEYDLLFDYPSKGYSKSISQMVLNKTDPGQAAYVEIRSKAYAFQDNYSDQGREGQSTISTKRSRAMHRLKLANKFGDTSAAKKAEDDVYKFSRTPGAARKALKATGKSSEPLGMLTRVQEIEFYQSLSPAEKKKLKRAEGWFRSK